jgi:hypothetical protein
MTMPWTMARSSAGRRRRSMPRPGDEGRHG